MILDELLDRLEGVRRAGNGYVAICPAHDDNEPSLGVTEGEEGIVLKCHAGCETPDVLAALGLEWGDLFLNPRSRRRDLGEPEAVYQYRDESGRVLFEAVRFPGKQFRQRHHAPEDESAREDGYVYNLEGVRRVLYRLPELIASAPATVYVCEGEKDVEALVAAGKVATCNPMGAGKWRDEFSHYLRGRKVIVVVDRDEPGRNHAYRVRDSLLAAGAEVWLVHAKTGKDAYDHLAAGHAPEDFVPLKERVKRGIATAREMSEAALLRLNETPETAQPEFVVPVFGTLAQRPLSFRNGRLYTLGGYTGDGKTSLALQLTRVLSEAGAKIGFFTLEMTRDDLVNRLITHHGLPLFAVEHPWTMSEPARRLYEHAAREIAEWPLEIIYDSSVSADTISETTVDREYSFVIIDHIHRSNWGSERRKLESEIVALTNLALEFNIPVLVLAQLRRFARGKDMEAYPRPMLQDFRETEVLGTESAMALAVWRRRDPQGLTYDPSGSSELIVLKNRHGATGSFHVRFDPARTLFESAFQGDTHAGSQAEQPGAAHLDVGGAPQDGAHAGESDFDWLA